jgi:hypothetical protein
MSASGRASIAAGQGSISLGWLAFWTGFLPLLVGNLAYLGSALGGNIPLCFPYLQGCTSISAAGRYGLSYFFFKAGMIPAAVLLAAFWFACRRWLLALGAQDGRLVRAMVVVGCTSAAFLILYTVFLGSKGDFYNLMRRYGVTVYFSFSYLAQLMLLSRLRQLRTAGQLELPDYILRGKLALAVALLALGLGSIPISNFVVEKDRPENAVEWMFSLLMVSYYLLTWRAWRHSDFRISLSVRPSAGDRSL